MTKNILSFPHSQPILSSTAKVVDGRLVLSLTDALKPVVWQFDISVAKSSAIELRETNGGETTLILKTAKQDVQEIASYDSIEKAVKALHAISRAMERAQGHMNAPQAGTYPPPAVIPQSFGVKQFILKAFWNVITTLIVLFVLALAIIWFVPLSGDNQTTPTSQQSEQELAPNDNSVPTPTGEPLSADDFLNTQ